MQNLTNTETSDNDQTACWHKKLAYKVKIERYVLAAIVVGIVLLAVKFS